MVVRSVDTGPVPETAKRALTTKGDGSGWAGLAVEAARARVTLDAAQVASFARYRDVLLDWNRRVNLTAVTDPVEVERRLFLDSLRLVPYIDRLVSDRPTRPWRLVDVGSGAGFPALAIKIVCPEIEMTLIEATAKKAAFLSRTAAELDLAGVSVRHERAEVVARETEQRETYDLVTARAVAALPTLLELTTPLLRVGGQGLFPKGLAIGDELAAGQRAAALLGARILASDRLAGSETRLIVVAKEAPTPARYPRRPGIPTRDPLGLVDAAPSPRSRRSGRQ